MTKCLIKGVKVASAISALLASAILLTSCDDTAVSTSDNSPVSGAVGTLPPSGGTTTNPPVVVPPDVPGPISTGWDVIELMVRTDPADPHNERYLDDWRFQIHAIDDQARTTSPVYFGETGPDGNGAVGLPSYLFNLPLIINAYNDSYPLADLDNDEELECRSFEIFVPANCYDKAVWLLGPVEDAVWDFYRKASERRAEAWNPSQVDCGTWLANLQQLILTDSINDALTELSDSATMLFDPADLTEAWQENQNLLTPTRPPICMAERRHNGGGLERGDTLTFPATGREIDDDISPYELTDDPMTDNDPIIIGANGGPISICGIEVGDTFPATDLGAVLTVNGNVFSTDVADSGFIFDDSDFDGTVQDDSAIDVNIDAHIFNIRLGNGRERDHDKYDDACALTTLVEFTNTDDDEHDVLTGSGWTFDDLFSGDSNAHVIDTVVYLTSDGDAVVGDNDYWAIFYDEQDTAMEEHVLVVELLGHRQEDFRDVLHMTFDEATDDLFLGLRADYELNEEEVDGERAFLGFTIHTWDGSSAAGRAAVRENIANCYEASDVWARQFFATVDFQTREDECGCTGDCEIASTIKPLVAAEFAVRSQCFSNSRANSRWQTDDVGFWSMNTIHGVAGNVIINPGWLAPNMDFEIYIQKFDEAVFKGPRTIRRTDECGQLMAEVPTLVEGDRVMIKAEDNCCDDYDIVLPCVPEFTGFAGAPGVPYVPVILAPPAVPPAI